MADKSQKTQWALPRDATQADEAIRYAQLREHIGSPILHPPLGARHDQVITNTEGVLAWKFGHVACPGNRLTPWQFYPPATDMGDFVVCSSANTFFLSEGSVWSCGSNDYMQLGHSGFSGTSANPNVTKLVFPGLGLDEKIIQAASSYNFTYFLTDTGYLYRCGDNSYGQLIGTSNPTLSLARCTAVSGVKKVSAGDNFVYILKEDGTVWNAGFNGNGELGRAIASGSASASNFGQLTDPLVTDVKDIVSSRFNTWILTGEKNLVTIGRNTSGVHNEPLARTLMYSPSPVNVSIGLASYGGSPTVTPTEIVSMSLCGTVGVIVDSNGRVYGTGHQVSSGVLPGVTLVGGQMEVGSTSAVPSMVQAKVSPNASMYLGTDNKLYCCGDNSGEAFGVVLPSVVSSISELILDEPYPVLGFSVHSTNCADVSAYYLLDTPTGKRVYARGYSNSYGSLGVPSSSPSGASGYVPLT